MKRSLSIPSWIAAATLVSCQYNPYAHRFSKHEPKIEEAAGTYVLEEVHVDSVEQGLTGKIRNYAATSRIILRHDGTAAFIRFPVFKEPDSFDYTYSGPEDFNARWSIIPVGSVSSGGDDSTTVYGVHFTFDGSRELFDSPTFTGTPAVDGMIFTLFDGDQGQILGYRKK